MREGHRSIRYRNAATHRIRAFRKPEPRAPSLALKLAHTLTCLPLSSRKHSFLPKLATQAYHYHYHDPYQTLNT